MTVENSFGRSVAADSPENPQFRRVNLCVCYARPGCPANQGDKGRAAVGRAGWFYSEKPKSASIKQVRSNRCCAH